MVHLTKVQELYRHYTGSIKPIDFHEIDSKMQEENYVYFSDGFFIHQAIYMLGNMSDLLEESNGKPFYIPDEEEYLKYLNEYYIKETKEYRTLYQFLQKHAEGDAVPIEEVILEIGHPYVTERTNDMSSIITRLITLGIAFDDMKDINELVTVVTNYLNNFKIWNNRGYSPKELHDLSSKPKISRNDPCPCGSGKKYKKCCIDKEVISQDDSLFYENVFLITDEEKENYLSEMRKHYKKIIPYMALYDNPSYHDLLDMAAIFIHDNHQIRPKDMVAALAATILTIHEQEDYLKAIETIFRAIGVWTVRDSVLHTKDIILRLYKMYASEEAIEKIIYKHKDTIKDIIDNPFEYIRMVQTDTKVNIETHNKILDYIDVIIEVEVEDPFLFYVALLLEYPLSYPLIDEMMNYLDNEELLIDAHYAYMYAFEQTNQQELLENKDEFALYHDNKRYILAIDQLAMGLKHQGKYHEAIEVLNKGIKYDDLNRFALKEAILVCYLYTGQMEEFNKHLNELDEDSFYKPFINLFTKTSQHLGFHKDYLDAYNKSKKLLDIFINDELINMKELDQSEQDFIIDFYSFYHNKTFITDELVSLHNDSGEN
jgi:hypothetical protein